MGYSFYSWLVIDHTTEKLYEKRSKSSQLKLDEESQNRILYSLRDALHDTMVRQDPCADNDIRIQRCF